MESGNVVFVDEYELSSKEFEVTDYVIDINEKDRYYLPLNKEIEIGKEVISVGNPLVTWITVSDAVKIENGKLKAIKVGNAVVKAISNNKVVHEINVVVTDTIVEKPKKFNKKKKYLPCKEFTEEEARLLDEILEYRVNEVGYGTRAAAVEVVVSPCTSTTSGRHSLNTSRIPLRIRTVTSVKSCPCFIMLRSISGVTSNIFST